MGDHFEIVLPFEWTKEDEARAKPVEQFALKVGGQFLAMKSVDIDDEIQRARSAIAQLGGKIGKIWDYAIPGTDVRHRVVIIRKERPTPAAYPRPFARIKKAPLG